MSDAMQEATYPITQLSDGSRMIFLTQAKIAIVDNSDYRKLMRNCWTFNCNYAIANINGKREKIHRVVMNAPPKQIVHHIDGDTMNNRKSNLVFASKSLNMHSRKLLPSNTSGLKGVSKRGNRWLAKISIDGKQIYLGFHSTKEEAHKAYCDVANAHHGEFARTA